MSRHDDGRDGAGTVQQLLVARCVRFATHGAHGAAVGVSATEVAGVGMVVLRARPETMLLDYEGSVWAAGLQA
ncbi:hypothetical protein PF006_g14583 [Phytophthora fragariae]|uniref:Uncharacterized protein n=1 Tax=Phytophthora fragariae TaxID=53985 RepID=A0A6A3K214_9STRA|nr:hypothetical protein PF009_g16783 [Phytophthora fragariae]KAE8999598.1 hypothetical protein PF011_g14571 [Phytophthora fragariae]KAE9135565.1 hypothetical protein PF006_g14583 [Phytophthora fragariae]KAE9190090.1 hypothetical protein PF004_g22010 [Phytophthora fragariae]